MRFVRGLFDLALITAVLTIPYWVWLFFTEVLGAGT